MCDDCKYFVYNLRWYIYYTVHTCDIVSFCFCKAVSFCIIIYKLNYSSVSNKMFCSPTCMTTRTGFYSIKREKGVFVSCACFSGSGGFFAESTVAKRAQNTTTSPAHHHSWTSQISVSNRVG